MPVDPGLFVAFLLAVALICVAPGPDMLYVVANGLTHGRRGGLAAAVGMQGGMLVHTLAAVVGLSALVQSSATAFTAIRVAGIVYLVWLAVGALRGHGAAALAAGPAGRTSRSSLVIARKAAITNLLNPKVIAFYVAFLPQFVDTSRGAVGVQLLILGVTLMAVGLVVDAILGVLAGSAGQRLARSARVLRALDRLAAAVYLGLAARLVADR